MKHRSAVLGLLAAVVIAAAAALTVHADSAAPQPAAPPTYNIDPVHSFVVFQVGHLGIGNVWGRFNQIDGTIAFDPANPAAGKIQITVPIASVDTGNQQRDNHLRNPDFFDVEKYPNATFESQSITPIGNGRYRLAGMLEIHGVKLPITTEFTAGGPIDERRGGKRIAGQAEFLVNRTQHGMEGMAPAAGETARVFVSIEAVQRAAQ